MAGPSSSSRAQAPAEPAKAAVLGVDIGPRGLELALVAADQRVLATHHRAYPGDHAPHRPGDPADWWRAVRTGSKEILRRGGIDASVVRAIGVTGESATVAIDRAGEALAHAVLGSDARDAPGLATLQAQVGARTLANLAGGTPDLSCGLVQLLALREREKRAWHDLRHVVAPKDYIRLRFTETVGTDPSDAAASLLYNPRSRSWSRQLAQLLDLPFELLPPVGPSHSLGGRVTEAAARDVGVVAGTPVVTGCHRLAAMAVACHATQPGDRILELGGSGGLMVLTAEPMRDPEGRFATGCPATAGLSCLTTTDRTGGHGLEWALETVLPDLTAQARRQGRDPLLALAEVAADAPAGADGLHWSLVDGHGCLSHVRPLHGRAHVARAVMEGAARSMRQLLARLDQLHVPAGRIYLAGRGTSAALWCQILADVLGHEVTSVTMPESAALGAAWLAAGAVGLTKKTAQKPPPWLTAWSPRKAAVQHYATAAATP